MYCFCSVFIIQLKKIRAAPNSAALRFILFYGEFVNEACVHLLYQQCVLGGHAGLAVNVSIDQSLFGKSVFIAVAEVLEYRYCVGYRHLLVEVCITDKLLLRLRRRSGSIRRLRRL